MSLFEDLASDMADAYERQKIKDAKKRAKLDPEYVKAKAKKIAAKAAKTSAEAKLITSRAYEASQKRKQDWQDYVKAQTRKKELESDIGGPVATTPISSKDPEGTAYAKAMGNVLNLGGRAISTGAKLATRHFVNKYEKQNKTGEATTSTQPNRPLLPAGKVEKPVGLLPPSIPPSPGKVGRQARKNPSLRQELIRQRGGTSSPIRVGAAARKDPKLRQQLIAQRGGTSSVGESYEFSCWREEFLYELGDLRKKARLKDDDEKIIDVMRGENKITLNPTVSNETYNYNSLTETTNGASIFAKATPPLKKRTTPMSDVYLANQPGRGTAEKVEAAMRKLFLGDRKGFTSNYDLSLTPAAQSRVNEAYDDEHEEFRQHSQERFTAGNGDSTKARRTASVLKRIAAMNQNVEQPKKKKKKKKKEGQD